MRGNWADARELDRRAATRRSTEKRAAAIERTVLLGAYVMRKLDDSKKLSTSWRGRAIRCVRHEPVGPRPNLANWQAIDVHYDLDRSRREVLGARALCDMVIHSYIFLLLGAEDRSVAGFLVTSDTRRADGLWRIGVGDFVRLMEQTADDRPTSILMVRDDETDEYEMWRGRGQPPEHRRKK